MAEFERVLDANSPKYFRTIYQTVNWCAGENLTNWQMGCWPGYKPRDGFRMWFIQLAPKENVPAVREFVNVITEGGDYVVFDDLGNGHPSMRREDNYWGCDLVFAKEVDGLYTFRGVFVRDGEKSEPNHLVSKRVATKVRLFGGPPARSLELLDEVDAKGYVRTATVPAKPKGRVRKANGAIMIKCARCGKSFESAAKCPECGQIVKQINRG